MLSWINKMTLALFAIVTQGCFSGLSKEEAQVVKAHKEYCKAWLEESYSEQYGMLSKVVTNRLSKEEFLDMRTKNGRSATATKDDCQSLNIVKVFPNKTALILGDYSFTKKATGERTKHQSTYYFQFEGSQWRLINDDSLAYAFENVDRGKDDKFGEFRQLLEDYPFMFELGYTLMNHARNVRRSQDEAQQIYGQTVAHHKILAADEKFKNAYQTQGFLGIHYIFAKDYASALPFLQSAKKTTDKKGYFVWEQLQTAFDQLENLQFLANNPRSKPPDQSASYTRSEGSVVEYYSREPSGTGLISLKELVSDAENYIDKPVKIYGFIKLVDYFNYKYRGANSTHYAFEFCDYLPTYKGKCANFYLPKQTGKALFNEIARKEKEHYGPYTVIASNLSSRFEKGSDCFEALAVKNGIDSTLLASSVKIPDFLNQIGVAIEKMESYWKESPADFSGKELYTPVVRIYVRNNSENPIDQLQFDGDFLKLEDRESFGVGSSSLGNKETLKPGEKRFFDLNSSIGYTTYVYQVPQIEFTLKLNKYEIGKILIVSANRIAAEFSHAEDRKPTSKTNNE